MSDMSSDDPKESNDKKRRHSATPSDVLGTDDSSNPSLPDTSSRSSADQDFKEVVSQDRLRRLEYLEGQFSNFASFTAQRALKRPPKPGHRPKSDTNNNGRPVRRTRDVYRSEDQSDEPQLIQFSESPEFITGQMRDYQVEGLNWLITLFENGINGFLADEMGLGKTLQAISLIGYLKHYKKINGPHVIIVPLSTIENWTREFQRFLPGVRVLHGHCRGDKKELHQTITASRRNWDVVVTSYQFFVTEHSQFSKLNYQYVVLDEAQRCKNENSQLSQVMRRTAYRNILFMTGTPINNNLHELWALLNLLLPDFFRNSEDFDDWFKVEDCIDPNHERAVRLKAILQPIMLRRIKADVEATIPPKIKTTIFIPPTRQMNYWSKKVLCKNINILKGNGTFTRFALRIVFPYLREVTLHPYLIPGGETEETLYVTQDIVDVCSRMIVLDKLLTELHKRGSRVLLFTQMVMMIEVLQDYMEWKGYKYHRMTGNTRQQERQEMIDEFNSPGSDTFIFMITTRTGGIGINLQSADTVIFYDLDWNPQADFQAEDRAHRIGQTKQVHVIRFTVTGTVDEYVHICSNRKQALDKAIIRKSLGDAAEFAAVDHHRRNLENVNCIDVSAVDGQLSEMFAEIDRGERNAQNNTLLKSIRLKSKRTRTPSEDRELASIKPAPTEYVVPEFDLNRVGPRLRPRKPKRAFYDDQQVVKPKKKRVKDESHGHVVGLSQEQKIDVGQEQVVDLTQEEVVDVSQDQVVDLSHDEVVDISPQSSS